MASRIKAINALRPKLERGRTVQISELVAYLKSRSGLTAGQLTFVLSLLEEAVAFYNRAGRGVKLPGLGTYLPNIQLDGRLDVEHRLDRGLKGRLNNDGPFTGKILNRGNRGKTAGDLMELWNQIHPDDPVEAP